MSDYRRWYVPGGTYFFTLVVENRRPLFATPETRALLGNALRTIHGESPFRTVAMVLLPDHLHAIWQLPSNDCDYSTRWQRIKARFTTDLRCSGYRMPKLSLARQNRGERGIWQRRFWEHVIRDEAELEAYFDYIHWNPVKHGYVRHPAEWESTTYHRHVRSGHYPKTWGSTEPSTLGCIDDQLCE
jgi:putative transposase